MKNVIPARKNLHRIVQAHLSTFNNSLYCLQSKTIDVIQPVQARQQEARRLVSAARAQYSAVDSPVRVWSEEDR